MEIRELTARWLTVSGIAVFLGMVLSTAHADAGSEMIVLRAQWDVATYQLPVGDREAAYVKLADEARARCEQYPGDAALLIWKGIIVSSLAGEQGGLGALKLVKKAKASLEQALTIDPATLDGPAYTTLGSLYHAVPGWPIGFGSDKKARVNLEKALTIDPAGIESNYYMAELMLDEGEYSASKTHLLKAMAAHKRPGRAMADAGRRQQVTQMLTRVETRLK